jgi:hypothetical protein
MRYAIVLLVFLAACGKKDAWMARASLHVTQANPGANAK